MPNSNDVARNEMLWQRVPSLLVVGASYHHYFTDFHRGANRVLTATMELATAILTTGNSVAISMGQKHRKCQNGH